MNQMDNFEENDPIWDLLDEARPPAPSPFFARNVVREVRKLEDPVSWGSRLVGWLRTPPAMAGSLAAVAIAAVGIFALISNDPQSAADPTGQVVAADPEAPTSAFDPASELEAVEYLGQLMAVTDPGQLSDEALGDLFF